MRLTPLDIRHKEFKRGMRGYVDAEVDEFLDAVADEFDRLFKENIDFSERLAQRESELSGRAQGVQQEIAALQQQVAQYHELEATLQKTLLTAQHNADELAAQARRDADAFMQQTEHKARELLSEAYADRERVEKDMAALHDQEADFRLKFRAMLEGYLQQLRALDETARGRTAEYERQTQALRDSLATAARGPQPQAGQPTAVPPQEPAPRPAAPQTQPAEPAPPRPPAPPTQAPPADGPPQTQPQPDRVQPDTAPEQVRPAPDPSSAPAEQSRPAPPHQAQPAPSQQPQPTRPQQPIPPQQPSRQANPEPSHEPGDETALTMTPETAPMQRQAGRDDEDTELTFAPLPDDDAFFGEEDGGNTEFKW